MYTVIFADTEVSPKSNIVLDYGTAVDANTQIHMSPLLFPNKPYHVLLKDDKLQTDALNNPLNDSIKAMELFYDEVNAFYSLNELQKDIYADLLYQKEEFHGFFFVYQLLTKKKYGKSH